MNQHALGMGAGAGLGSVLGKALGYPGASIRGLLNFGVDPDASAASALPGILSLLGGAGGFMLGGPGTAAIGATAMGGLAQALGETFGDAEPVSGRQLVENTVGADVGDFGGMGVEMLLDPMTYLGAGAGSFLGKHGAKEAAKVMPAAEKAAFQQASKAGAGEALAASEKIAAQAEKAAHVPTLPKPGGLSDVVDDWNRASAAGYSPEATAMAPDVFAMGKSADKIGKSYKQVNPALSSELDLLGYLNPKDGGGTLNAGHLPPWAEQRGGWLMPDKTRMMASRDPGAALGMVSRNPSSLQKIGPRIDPAAGPMGLLSEQPTMGLNLSGNPGLSQAEKYAAMRAEVPGLGGPMGEGAGKAGFAEALGEGSDPLERWLAMQADREAQSGVSWANRKARKR